MAISFEDVQKVSTSANFQGFGSKNEPAMPISILKKQLRINQQIFKTDTSSSKFIQLGNRLKLGSTHFVGTS